MSGIAATSPNIVKSEVISLNEASISEAMLEKVIADDPSVLGLGDVALIERQRAQAHAGRLDLLFEDADGEMRYEVELMLGSLDESHLIRTVEYWDIERRRYPGYEHRAVIIAEDITSRFLNVIQLLTGSIPIIAIQVNCIKVGDSLTLNFIRVLDSTKLRRDDHVDVKAEATDRNYWLNKVGPGMIGIADECAAMIDAAANCKWSLNYKKQFIGLTDGIQVNNFVKFLPRKNFMRIRIALNNGEEWSKRLEDAGMDFGRRDYGVAVNLTPETLGKNRSLVNEILQDAVRNEES